MKKIITFLAITGLLISGIEVKAQVAISASGAAPNASAMLDVNSSSLGLLFPNFSSKPASLNAAAPGLVMYYGGSLWLNTSATTSATWVQLGAGGSSVTDVTASSPLFSSGGTTPNITIQVASGSQNGYLSSGDWTTFNNKLSSVPIASGSTLGGVKVGSGLSIDGTGVLSTSGGSGSVTSITTTAPITGGPITTTGTIAISQATTSTDGYLSSANWNTFNGKEPALGNPGTSGYVLSSTTAGVRSWVAPGGLSFLAPLVNTSGVISIPKATSSVNGYLSAVDFTTFNSKWTKSGNALFYTNNVSIGTSSISNRLVVEDQTDGTYSSIISNLANTTSSHVLQLNGGMTGGDYGSNFILFTTPDGTPIGSVTQANAGNVMFNTTSDSTLKENIKNTQYSLNDLLKIKVRDFNWKNDKSKKIITGFIAQELYKVYPNAVTKPRSDKDKWMLSKEELVPLLVKSIQDQQSTIESLHTQVKNQQTVIDDLLKRVEALEKK